MLPTGELGLEDSAHEIILVPARHDDDDGCTAMQARGESRKVPFPGPLAICFAGGFLIVFYRVVDYGAVGPLAGDRPSNAGGVHRSLTSSDIPPVRRVRFLIDLDAEQMPMILDKIARTPTPLSREISLVAG